MLDMREIEHARWRRDEQIREERIGTIVLVAGIMAICLTIAAVL